MLPQEIFSAIFESPAQGVLCASPDGIILYSNQTLSRMFGYPPGELTGSLVETLLPEALRAAHARHREGYRAGPVVRPMGAGVELSGRRKDGTEFPVEVSLNRAQTGSGFIVVAFVADITARKDLERRFAQSQKMEALGLLAAGLAHDFNNLLTIIMGHLDDSTGRLPVEHPLRESAEAALKASHQSAELVSQLFAFARRPISSRTSVDVNLVLTEHEAVLRRVAGPNLELTFQLDPAPCLAVAEGEEIQRAVVNLVANARDATPPGGWILIETCRAELDHNVDPASLERRNRPYVLLSVSDNGRGMTKEVQQRIFEPFFTTKERGRGAGLGLALVYAAVKGAGGEIRVHSQPERGTSVKMFLPRVAPGAKGPAGETSHAGGGGTILVVDDQGPIRELCAAMLQTLGYRALTASGADEAIAISRSHDAPIDVLLTDVLMPGTTGPDLARALSAEMPDLRVVFMSGYTSGSIERHHLVDAAAGFLPKPFTLEQLESVVRQHARGRDRGSTAD